MTDLQNFKTVCTIWYYLRSIDGIELIEGPTPELISIDHATRDMACLRRMSSLRWIVSWS